MRRRSLVRLVVAPVVAVAVLAGCGSSEEEASSAGSSSGPSSAEAVGQLQEAELLTEEDLGDRVVAALREAGTLAFTVEQSGVVSGRGAGVADLSGDRPAARVTQEVQGVGKVEAVLLDGVLFLRAARLGGEKWLEIDPSAKQGLGALVGSMGGTHDPAELLEVLDRAGEVSAEGEEEVGGVATTRYHVVLPREALAETLGSNPQVTQMLPQDIELDVWVDGDDLVRKQVSELTIGGQQASTTITYSGFGDRVDIEAPPASQTTTEAPGLGR